MADGDGFLLDEESILQLRRDHEELWSQVHSPNRRRHINHAGGGGGGSAVGRATSAITPADDSLAGTSFTFRKFVVDDSATTPKTLKEEEDDSDGVNRFKHLSAGVDAIVMVVKIHGEWTVVSCEDACSE